MSKSILEALYYGEIRPCEQRMRRNPVRKEMINKIENEENYLKSKLSCEDWDHFQELCGLCNDVTGDNQADIFSRGFVIGALLIFEIMERKDKLTNA